MFVLNVSRPKTCYPDTIISTTTTSPPTSTSTEPTAPSPCPSRHSNVSWRNLSRHKPSFDLGTKKAFQKDQSWLLYIIRKFPIWGEGKIGFVKNISWYDLISGNFLCSVMWVWPAVLQFQTWWRLVLFWWCRWGSQLFSWDRPHLRIALFLVTSATYK